MTASITPVDINTDTWLNFVTKFNTAANVLTTMAVTVDSNAAVGNAEITGTFTSSALVANTLTINVAGVTTANVTNMTVDVTVANVTSIVTGNVVTLSSNAATIANGNVVALSSNAATINVATVTTGNVATLTANVATINVATVTTGNVATLTSNTATINVATVTTGNVRTLTANAATINVATVTTGNVATLTANVATINVAVVTTGNVTTLNSNTATINVATVTTGNVRTLTSNTATINVATVTTLGVGTVTGTGNAYFSGYISSNAVYAQHTGGAAAIIAKRNDLVASPNWSTTFQWQAPNNAATFISYGNLVGRVSNGTVGAEAGHWLLTQYNGGVNTSIFDTVNAQFNLAVPLNTSGGLAAPATLRSQLGMSANGQSLVTAANYAAMRTLLLNEGKIRQVVFGSSGSSNSTNGAPYAPVLGQPATLYMTASDSSCLVIYNFQYTVSNGTGTPTGYTVPSYLNSSGVWTSMGFATTHTMSVGATAPGGTLAGRSSYIWTMAPGQRYTNLWQCRLQGGTASTATTLTIGVCEWVLIEYGGS